jgi:hypothetical protein
MAAELKITVQEFQDSLLQISNSTIAALDELWTVSDSSGDQISLLDTIQDPDAPTRRRRWTSRASRTGWPTRSRACPSARSSSWRCTTTRT